MKNFAESVARAFVAAISRGDLEGLAELMTPGCRFVDSLGSVVEGRETFRAGWVGYFRMVPDYRIDVEESYCGEKSGTAGPSTSLRMTDRKKSWGFPSKPVRDWNRAIVPICCAIRPFRGCGTLCRLIPH